MMATFILLLAALLIVTALVDDIKEEANREKVPVRVKNKDDNG